MALTACLLIVLFVKDELSYDAHFSQAEDIYRVVGAYRQGGDSLTESARTTFMLAPEIESSFPEIRNAVRLNIVQNTVTVDEQPFLDSGLIFADPYFFQLFDFEFIHGSAETFRNSISSIVITESAAMKYFGVENPAGQTLVYAGIPFLVGAVIEDIPENTHFAGNIVFPIGGIEHLMPEWMSRNAGGTSHLTYLLLQRGTDINQLADKISEHMATTFSNYFREGPFYSLQNIKDIHLTSNLIGELAPNGSILYVYVFAVVVILILMLAYINYANLFMAISLERAKEIGINKLLGATNQSQRLKIQLESIMISVVSGVIAVVLAQFAMPIFIAVAGKNIEFSFLSNLPVLLGIMAVIIASGFISGSVPARFLLNMGLSDLMRGGVTGNLGSKYSLRNGMILFQFFVATSLITGSILIVSQVNFLRDKDLGINTELAITIPVTSEIRESYESFRSELLDIPAILNVTASANSVTDRIGGWRQYVLEGRDEEINVTTMLIEHEFFQTLDAELVAGRFFAKDIATDATRAYVLNESGARFLSLENPVGTGITGSVFDGSQWSRKDAKIIGVVKDFHTASLHSPIQPLIYSLITENTFQANVLVIRLASGSVNSSIGAIENLYSSISPGTPFRYEFMDDAIQEHYESDQQTLIIFTAFSILSILIGCIGLFGITAFMLNRRTKEIGIRKVLGADLWSLVNVLSRDLLILVFVASLLSWPVAYFAANQWLRSFAYRIDIPLWPFLVTSLTALLIASATVGYHSLRAARANPIDSIQYE